MYCTDPGEVEHSTRLISDPVLLVGTTIQYTCNPGFVLEGSSLLTCYSRETGTPIWTSRLPHCVSEESLACDNPGLPENGYQILYKRLYLPGESLTFMCYEGFELMGEVTIKCILGQPSHWSGPLPICKGSGTAGARGQPASVPGTLGWPGEGEPSPWPPRGVHWAVCLLSSCCSPRSRLPRLSSDASPGCPRGLRCERSALGATLGSGLSGLRLQCAFWTWRALLLPLSCRDGLFLIPA
uniref:Sushi domain-containing protein n=1 Tax=Anser cygnoides TaxID=8845 RepID=A0A8B9DUG0_ANSCY